jgi:hypothetical protein
LKEIELQRQAEREERHQTGITHLKDQLRQDFNQLQQNLAKNMNILKKEGIDYEDIFKEDTEEVSFNFTYDVALSKIRTTEVSA